MLLELRSERRTFGKRVIYPDGQNEASPVRDNPVPLRRPMVGSANLSRCVARGGLTGQFDPGIQDVGAIELMVAGSGVRDSVAALWFMVTLPFRLVFWVIAWLGRLTAMVLGIFAHGGRHGTLGRPVVLHRHSAISGRAGADAPLPGLTTLTPSNPWP